jgi:hypothetical protein
MQGNELIANKVNILINVSDAQRLNSIHHTNSYKFKNVYLYTQANTNLLTALQLVGDTQVNVSKIFT